MIGRIGFRRLLPALFVLVHVALLGYAAYQHSLSRTSLGPPSHAAKNQQEESVTFELEPKPLTPAQKLAIVLNLPAMVVAIPIATTLFQGSDTGLLYAALPLVPFVWYWIGRWIDRLLGTIRHSPGRASLWINLFTILAAGWLTLSALVMTPLNHHRTSDTYWIGSASVVWSGLFLAMCLSRNSARHDQLT